MATQKERFNEACQKQDVKAIMELADEVFPPAVKLWAEMNENHAPKETLRQYLKLGEDIDALAKVGVMYCKGVGTERNPEEGLKLIERALERAKNGDTAEVSTWNSLGDVFTSGATTKSGNWQNNSSLENSIGIKCYENKITECEKLKDFCQDNEMKNALDEMIGMTNELLASRRRMVEHLSNKADFHDVCERIHDALEILRLAL